MSIIPTLGSLLGEAACSLQSYRGTELGRETEWNAEKKRRREML